MLCVVCCVFRSDEVSLQNQEKRVLVIDDNDFCREFIMSGIVALLGEESQVDGVGTSAHTALNHLLNITKAYDLVVVDMSMPMDLTDNKLCNENERAGLWVSSQILFHCPKRRYLTFFFSFLFLLFPFFFPLIRSLRSLN